jgi:hypothetical protein
VGLLIYKPEKARKNKLENTGKTIAHKIHQNEGGSVEKFLH